MGVLSSIITGLLTALIGYIVGRAWQRFIDQRPYRHARIFWGPLLGGEVQIIVSRFWSDSFIEPTGIVGGGDALALREISSYFAKVGLKQAKVVYVDEASVDRTKNLVLLGGVDTNEITKDALGLIRPRVRLVDPGPGIPMEIHDLAPDAGPHQDKSSRGRVKMRRHIANKSDLDYGLIIGTRNPFNSARFLIIFAGAYGYGTWGGVNLALQDSFIDQFNQLRLSSIETRSRSPRGLSLRYLNHARAFFGAAGPQDWPQFECIFRVKIFDKRPHAPEVIVLRHLL